tara:strand:- start:199 stop:870 length:672 start_codon:yes stop_codon:yes gene_type:complete
MVDKEFAPRIPKPHNEILWGFKNKPMCAGSIITPNRYLNESLWLDEWDSTQHIIASILTGDVNANTIIRKLSSSRYTSKTKLAATQFNNVLKTNFLLEYVHDVEFRHAVERALNRGESFNRLYRAIAFLNKGQLRGTSEVEMMIWDACTRLLAGIIQYYNAYILNELYEKTNDAQLRELILGLSPTAWTHINLLGHYRFLTSEADDIARWLSKLRFEEIIKFG